MAAYSAFTRWVLIDPPPRWIGLANFREMFTEDRYFGWSLGITLKYMGMTLIPFMILGLAISLLLNQKLPGMNVFRTVFYVPAVVSTVATAILFMALLDPQFGAVNTLLRSLGVQNPPNWINSPDWALPSVAIMSLWGIGSGAIIYLAGLQNIPPHLYEAADIDGANIWQKFWRITIPLLSPTIFLVFITGIIGSFQVFAPAYILGGTTRFGGGSKYLRFYLLHLYLKGFQQGRLGYASALAWVLFIISAVTVFIAYNVSEKWVYYEEGGQERS
ncbi:MAG: sugar ABC transporter permease [Anaerolineae bacterium]|nr:sugar ABC transporter permease [Anaerolineae bacterium]